MKGLARGSLIVLVPGMTTWAKTFSPRMIETNDGDFSNPVVDVGPYIMNPMIAMVTETTSSIMAAMGYGVQPRSYIEAVSAGGHRLIVYRKDVVKLDEWQDDIVISTNVTRCE